IAQDLVHPHGAQHHAAAHGGAATHQTGAGAAGGDGDVVVVADLDDAGHLFGGEHVNGHLRHLHAVDGRFVPGVVRIDVGPHHDAAGYHLLQLSDDFRRDRIVRCHK